MIISGTIQQGADILTHTVTPENITELDADRGVYRSLVGAFTLKNTGNVSQTVTVNIQGRSNVQPDAEAVFPVSSTNSIALTPGQTRELTVNFTPLDLPGQDYSITLNDTWVKSV